MLIVTPGRIIDRPNSFIDSEVLGLTVTLCIMYIDK